MTVQWGKVYVFISSTFNDMHAERDYLVKQVFPQLAEWCERRKLRLVDIDLRWGVTEQDATENKRVVQVCLERIDACRPFFLCFLGQRRGWVPAKDDISPETFELYPELAKYAGDASVTEIEILHALVNPLHHGKVTRLSGGFQEYKPSEHSFFYLRRPDYLTELPTDLPRLCQVFTNEGVVNPEARHKADQELEKWRNVEVHLTGRPVHEYSAHWNPQESTPEIRLPLQCPSTTDPDGKTWQQAFFQWRSQWAEAGVHVDATGDINEPAEKEKAEIYNDRLIKGRLSKFTCDGTTLADTILADLQAAIQANYPDHVEITDLSPLQRELDQQAQFLQIASEGFIEREGDFIKFDKYIQGDSKRLLVLTAPGGLGKTSLLANWIDHQQINLNPGESLHYRFIGASDNSTTVDALLHSLMSEIKEVAGKITDEIPTEPEKLRAMLPALLEAAGKQGRTIIVLDGLNQLEKSLNDLSWMPMVLPPGIKLIASFKRGEHQAEAYYEQLQTSDQAILVEVEPFNDLDDRRKLVRAYLSHYLKELDEHHVESLIQSEGASNPLYLKVVLAELRVFGAFADLSNKIREDFGDSPVTAFTGLLRRLENDPAYSPIQPELLVPRLFGWLAHARTGLTIEELGELLIREKMLPIDETSRGLALEAVHGLLRQVRSYLARRESRFDFFYESFKLAVIERYVRREERAGSISEGRTSQAWHNSLATYFDDQSLRLGTEQMPNRRKLAELVFQLAHAGMTEILYQTLWNYDYLKARIEVSDIEILITDFDLAYLAEAGIDTEARRRLRLLQQTMRLSAHIIGRDIQQLPGQLIGRLLDFEEKEINKLLETARTEATGTWLKPLNAILGRPGDALQRTLAGNTKQVQAVAVTAGGELALTGDFNGTIKVWDLSQGRELRTLTGHSSGVNGVAISADGTLAISASADKTLKVWDVPSGTTIRTLTGHKGGVRAVAITPDGRIAVSASEDKTLKIWNITTGEEIRTLTGHSHIIRAIAITPDAKLVISASDDETLRVWNLDNNKKSRILRDHTSWVNAVALSADGKLAVSAAGGGSLLIRASKDTAIRVWDVANARLLQRMAVHADFVEALGLMQDGKTVVSTSRDGTIKVWDAMSGQSQHPLSDNCQGTTSLALSLDDRIAVTGGRGYSLKVWDLIVLRHGRRSNDFGHKEAVTDLIIALDGKMSMSYSKDGTMMAWDIASGKMVKPLATSTTGIGSTILTPDGRLAISESGSQLLVWDVWGGDGEFLKEIYKLEGHSDNILDMAITPDGRSIITASKDTTLKVWDVMQGRELQNLVGHNGRVSKVAINPAGDLAASASQDQIIIWDINTGKQRNKIDGVRGYASALTFTPDGRSIVCALGQGIKIWDLAEECELVSLIGNAGAIRKVALTADGKFLVSAGLDRLVNVWNVENGALVCTLEGHTGYVGDIEVTPDGRFVVSTANDGALKVWNLSAGNCVASFSNETGGGWLFRLATDAQYIVIGDAGGNVGILQFEGMLFGPPIVTPWQTVKDRYPAFGCPSCRTWSVLSDNTLGTDLRCPQCGKVVRLNPFTIQADWRAVAKAWKGDFPLPKNKQENNQEYYEPPPL
jgi:WD40 repeat protein